jgi:predicted hydrocarbon binding protein
VISDPARGELREGDARYLLIRSDSLMGLFRRLPEPARSQAFSAFADSLAEHGGSSARRYLSETERKKLLERIEATSGELGWGVWKFERENDTLALTVENSPFAHGHGPSSAPVCAAITGMLRAVAALVFEKEMRAEETACAASGAAVCRFRAESR